MVKKKTKKKVRKALSPQELKDLDLDPVEDKDTIEALSKDQEIENEDVLGDIEPKSDKDKEPEVKKVTKAENKKEIKDLEKVAKTENELQHMIATAKLNGVKEIEISEKLMRHFNRMSEDVPSYFWHESVMLILEGKRQDVHKRLNAKLY